jgi:hypothetical protein
MFPCLEEQQYNFNSCNSYTESMINTENCTLVTTAYIVPFMGRTEIFRHQILQAWNKALNKNTEIDASAIMQQTKNFQLIHPFVFLFHNGYCLLKNIKSISNL